MTNGQLQYVEDIGVKLSLIASLLLHATKPNQVGAAGRQCRENCSPRLAGTTVTRSHLIRFRVPCPSIRAAGLTQALTLHHA